MNFALKLRKCSPLLRRCTQSIQLKQPSSSSSSSSSSPSSLLQIRKLGTGSWNKPSSSLYRSRYGHRYGHRYGQCCGIENLSLCHYNPNPINLFSTLSMPMPITRNEKNCSNHSTSRSMSTSSTSGSTSGSTNNEAASDYVNEKIADVHKLEIETNEILSQYDNLSSSSTTSSSSSSSSSQKPTSTMANNLIHILERWHQLTQSIHIPIPSNKRNRFAYHANTVNANTANRLDLDNDKIYDLKELKLQCAQSMNNILNCHIVYNIPSNVNINANINANINVNDIYNDIYNDNDTKYNTDINTNPNLNHKTRPFSIVMEAWKHSTSPYAGDTTAAVLESWGEVYGGDMNHAPTIHEFNIVLDAYAIASSGNYDSYINVNEHEHGHGHTSNSNANSDPNANANNSDKTFPAELAWDIYKFLSQLNYDVTLLPNITSCSHIIHALSHHAFVVKYSSRDILGGRFDDTDAGTDAGAGTDDTDRNDNMNIDNDVNTDTKKMDSDIAAIRAFSVWKRMLELIKENEEKHGRRGNGTSNSNRTSNGTSNGTSNNRDDVNMNMNMEMDMDMKIHNNEQKLIWRAHNDVIGLSSHGMLRRDEVHQHHSGNSTDGRGSGSSSGGNILETVGRDTETLFNIILEKYHLDDDHAYDCNHARQAYLSVLFAWTKEQEVRIAKAHRNSSNSNNNDDNEELVMAVTRAALSAEALLVQMKEKNLKPSPAHYHTVIKAYLNCLDDKVLLLDESGSIGEDLLPHVSCLDLLDEMEHNCVLPAESEILPAYENEDDEQNTNLLIKSIHKIPASMYGDVIKAFVGSTQNNSPLTPSGQVVLTWTDIEKLEAVLHRMMDLYERDLLWINRKRQPLTFALNDLLRAYSQIESRYDESFERSTALLQRFNQIRSNHSRTIRSHIRQNPNVVTYTTYLNILSRSNTKDAGTKALDLLKEMEDNDITPNVATYTSAIKAIGRSRGGTNNIPAAKQLLFKTFKEYDELSAEERQKSGFNASALYASFISATMKKRANDPVESFRLLKYLNKRYDESKDPNLKPDVILYGTVLDSLSRQGGKKVKAAVSTSKQLLDKMESLFEQGELDMMPTKQCYTSAIITLSKSGFRDAPKQAEDILQRMEKFFEQTCDESVKPDHITYSAVLLTLSRSRLPIDIQRAEELTDIMENKANNLEIPWPNASAYTALINIYRNSGLEDMGERAEAVIQRMDEAYANQNYSVKADTMTFNAALNAWSSSSSPQKAAHSWNLFDEMCSRYDNGDISCKPNIITFSLVLNACAYTKEKKSHKDSIRIALKVQERLFQNVDVYGRPDSIFFSRLIKVFGFCISNVKDRQSFISVAFERCVEEGLVDDTVLESLKRFSPNLYGKLPGVSGGKVTVQSLPKRWSKNT